MDNLSDPRSTPRFPIGLASGLGTLVAVAAAAVWVITLQPQPSEQSQPYSSTESPSDRPQAMMPGTSLGILERSTTLAEQLASDELTPAPSSQASAPNGSNTEAAHNSPRVHWLANHNNRIALAPRDVRIVPGGDPRELNALLSRLLVGPNDPTLITTIPKDTTLLSVETKANGIHINLSQEFTAGGGSTSMISRVAQVLYTATSQDPSTPVWLSVEGQPLTTLGGEGILIPQPLTRQTFEQEFGTGY